MSPTSQGALEVERYIGSCLISTGRPGLQKPLTGCRKQEQLIGLKTSKQQQCQNQFGPVGTWAGGTPLISMASNPRRNIQRSFPNHQNQQQQISHPSLNEQQLQAHLHGRVPLSRLAVHTQGAPLILTGRFHNNRTKTHNGQNVNAISNCVTGLLNGNSNNNGNNGTVNNNISNQTTSMNRCPPQGRSNKSAATDKKKTHQQQYQSIPAKSGDSANNSVANKDTTINPTTGTNVANIDSLSIASDESSGSNNSENSLPRIIKPRKRRKKDRKPPVVNVVNSAANTQSTNDKVTEEVQQTPVVVSLNSTSSLVVYPNGCLSEQPQSQQHKSYNGNSYDNTRCQSDNNNYYKGHRRVMNNNARESAYGRSSHPGNVCFSNSSNNSNNASSNSTQSNSIVSVNPQQEVVDTRQQQQQQQQSQRGYAHRQLQVKVLDDNRNVILPVPVCQAKAAATYLRHNRIHGDNNGINNNASVANGTHFLNDFNEQVTLTCHRNNNGGGGGNMDDCIQGTICQCRFCETGTIVWDINEQSNYPTKYLAQPPSNDFGVHHHHHHHRYSQIPATVFLTTAKPFICQEHANAIEFFDVADSPCMRLRATNTANIAEKSDGAAILRRSWSDPSSYFNDEIVPNRDVGVIGDRGQLGDLFKGRSSWRGDASAAPSSPSNQSDSSTNDSTGGNNLGSQGPLEVSTEIVTSPNGHRDLEIKFYSSSPTSYIATPEEVKSAFAFPDDDDTTNDSEDYSDIWSYHESKLQQDFRTLLQAEE